LMKIVCKYKSLCPSENCIFSFLFARPLFPQNWVRFH